MKDIKLKSRKSKVSQKKIILLSALILCLFIGIGFAYIQSSLSIHGNSEIVRGTWDVHYENLVVKEGSVQTDNPATISEDKKNINLKVNFTKINQFYEFEVDIVNGGEIDAMLLDSMMLNQSVEMNNFISYSVEYLDNIDLRPNVILPSGTRERVRISFKMKIKTGTVMHVGENNFNLENLYVQATDDAKEKYRFLEGTNLTDGYLYGSSVTYDAANDKYILNDTISFSGINEIMSPLYEEQEYLNDLFNKILKYYDVIENTEDKETLENEMNTGLTNINKFDSRVIAIKDKLDKNSAYFSYIDDYNGILLDRMKKIIILSANGTNTNVDRKKIKDEIVQLNEECRRLKESITSWELNYEKVSTYKYTCLNESGECKMLYVLYDTGIKGVYYRPYINGDKE